MSEVELYCGDCLGILSALESETIDLTVTSPPYDNLRDYEGYTFDFEPIARELYRVTKPGGVVVWVVADATTKGSETGTSFRQALYFRDVCGFNLHDTMIWNKRGFSAVGALQTRYAPVFEYMFILSKGSIGTFNPLIDRKNKHHGKAMKGTIRNGDGTTKPMSNQERVLKKYGQRFNVWDIYPQRQSGSGRHPAPFPEALARDHILSWSNPGDLVLDPMMGSGTTGKMAVLNGRGFIGIDIAAEYVEIARQRIEAAQQQMVMQL